MKGKITIGKNQSMKKPIRGKYNKEENKKKRKPVKITGKGEIQ